MVENKKRKFKLENGKTYSLRKLRNVDLNEFRNLIIIEFKNLLTESEFNLVEKMNNLVVKCKCFSYKYSQDDFLLIKEASRIVNQKIPNYIKKNIDIYERAHFIKTIWGEYNYSNARGEHFKIELNE